MLSTVQYRPEAPARTAPRETGRLLADLAVIDVEGWGGPTGTALLDFVRDDLVRPLVLGTGLRDLAAWQAEATGWEAAWEALSHPSLPAAASPWGVVWTAVRRAVLGEVVTARYHASPRRAWALRAGALTGDGGDGGTPAPGMCRWEDLTEADHPTTTETDDDGAAPGVRGALTTARDALVRVGWAREVAEDLLERIVRDAAPGQGESLAKTGWRAAAADLGLPPWQVRRVMVALLGAPGWAGLLERLLRGEDAAADPGMWAALRATRVKSRRSPALEARRAEAARPQVGDLRWAS